MSDNPHYPAPADLPRIVEGTLKHAIQSSLEAGRNLERTRLDPELQRLRKQRDDARNDVKAAELRGEVDELAAVVRYLTNHPDDQLRTYALILGHELDRGEHRTHKPQPTRAHGGDDA